MSWYPPTVTVAATSDPLSLDEAKEYLEEDRDSQNGNISLLIDKARDRIERVCGPIMPRTATVKCDCFGDFAHFPQPLVSVSSITYLDAAGATQTLSTDVYEVRIDGLLASIVLKYGQVWPHIQAGSRITVTAVIGRSAVPGTIKGALVVMVSQPFGDRAKEEEWLNGILCNDRIF